MKRWILVWILFVSAASLPLDNNGNEDSKPPWEEGGNRTITDETIRQLAEAIKGFIDPKMFFKGFSYTVNNPKLMVNGSISEMNVDGLTSYEVKSTHAAMDKMLFVVSVNFPTINMTGHYDILSDIDTDYHLHLFGNGAFSLNGSDIDLKVEVNLGFTPNSSTLQMKNFAIDFNVGKIKVNLDNLEGDSELSQIMNELINRALPELIEDVKPNIQTAASQNVISFAQPILQNVNLPQLINYIYVIINM